VTTHMTTPSVEGDRLEAIARIIDPVAFGLVQSFVDYCIDRQIDGWKRFEFFLHTREAERIWVAYERARQIDALPCKGCEERGQLLVSNGIAYSEVYGQRELLAICLRRLSEACKRADADGDLSRHIDGTMLDRADELLGIPVPPKTGDLFKDAAPASALPCKGGEALTREMAEARIATLRRDHVWQARWMAGGQDERALWKRLTAIASGEPDPAATPTTEPDTGRGLREARKALLAAEQFIVNGVDLGFIRLPDQGDPALETLPTIRQALAALSDTPSGSSE